MNRRPNHRSARVGFIPVRCHAPQFLFSVGPIQDFDISPLAEARIVRPVVPTEAYPDRSRTAIAKGDRLGLPQQGARERRIERGPTLRDSHLHTPGPPGGPKAYCIAAQLVGRLETMAILAGGRSEDVILMPSPLTHHRLFFAARACRTHRRKGSFDGSLGREERRSAADEQHQDRSRRSHPGLTELSTGARRTGTDLPSLRCFRAAAGQRCRPNDHAGAPVRATCLATRGHEAPRHRQYTLGVRSRQEARAAADRDRR